MQISTRKFLILCYKKKRACNICNTSLFRQVVYSNRENQYCVYCAMIKNLLDVQDMNSYGYFPNTIIFQKALEKKKLKIIQMSEDMMIRIRDNKIKKMRKNNN